MTHTTAKASRATLAQNGVQTRALILPFLALFFLLLLLRNSHAALTYAKEGLSTVSQTVLPSLFPFMILSEILRAGVPERLLGRILSPISRLFHISPQGTLAFLLGTLCGAPVGARCLVAAYREGSVDRRECERLLPLVSPPSAAFLIGTVGSLLFGSTRTGIALLLSLFLSQLLCLRLFFPRPHATAAVQKRHAAQAPANLFIDAVRSSAQSMLYVSAYIVFFAVLSGAVALILSPLSLPTQVNTLIAAFFEISRAVELSAKTASPILCAAAAGWGGVCVHCQILSVSRDTDLSLRPYFLARALMSVSTAALIGLFL